MKRIISLCLILVFCFTLTACGDKGKKSELSVDVEYYANLGTMPECEYTLGGDIAEAESKLSTSVVDDQGEANYYSYESGNKTIMTDGTYCCCYETENAAAGITHIVKYGDSYGFTQGTISTVIRDAMAAAGFEAQERDARAGELFFIPGGTTLTVLQYDFKENTVLFVFQENALSASVIY